MDKLLNNIYGSENETELFSNICYLESYVEKNGKKIFFEEKVSKTKETFSIPKNYYTIQHIYKIFQNQYFINAISNILKYQRDYGLSSVPEKILKNGYLVNLFLNCSFYFVSILSIDFKQNNIEYIGKSFWAAIKRLERNFSYEFSKVDILNAFEVLVFDHKYFFQNNFPISIDNDNFYYILKKSRLITGNYLVDFSVPILLSNSFKKIISIKNKAGDSFSVKDSINRLRSVIRKYTYLSNGFKFDSLGSQYTKEVSSFEYYFSVRESTKVLLLVNLVVENLENFSHDEILKKIENSDRDLNKIKKFFYKNYNIFPDYEGSKTISGQWGNKSFLNTIKLFALLAIIKKSNDLQWKINVFLKHLSDWVVDLHDNINYFSELDDYDEIRNILISGENDVVEFKSTLGLPIQDCENEEQFNYTKRAIIEKIAKTILAMANSGGGDVFIGIIEKNNKTSKSIKPHIVERNSMYFLDVKFSLKKEGEDFDSKRLLIQQLLKNLTKERLDFLDSLFSFHFYKIYIEDKGSCIEILKISVKKSNKHIFIEKDNFITLPKRLNGRVEMINPIEEFKKNDPYHN